MGKRKPPSNTRKRRTPRSRSSIRKPRSRTTRARMQIQPRRSTRPSVAVKAEPETRINMEFKSVIATHEGETSLDKCISYFKHRHIPYVVVPDKIRRGHPCIVISEDHSHAGFFDGTSLWNPNDEPGGEGTSHGDGFDHLKMCVSKPRTKNQLVAPMSRGFTRCTGPGKSHNRQGLLLDSKGHIIPAEMVDFISDEGGQCFLLSLGYYQYAIKEKKDLCQIANLTHLEVMKLARKFFKKDIPY